MKILIHLMNNQEIMKSKTAIFEIYLLYFVKINYINNQK